MSVVVSFLEHWAQMLGVMMIALAVIGGGAYIGVKITDTLSRLNVYVAVSIVLLGASLLVTSIVTLVVGGKW